ncbi:TniQ family protein [Caballeronia sp. LZ032]|uniref:TniQ family protein n=1 Tax=Caballeronia sp. LZ032 TaxID=3038565 RepID=UPI00285C4979|nr:TniQ family protein [Caballeronia sp. LZ032]MDR5879417.1 hypothetical protein [Caballeronia sp. LZ032]
MRPVIELLGDTVGSVEEVLEHNTLLPLTARFLETDDHLFVKAHFLGDPLHGLQAKLGMNGPRSGWSKVRLLRCPECMKEDIGCCGNPFWRRDHLVPGLLFCGKHGIPLHEACEECMDFAKNPERVLHAGHHCGCGLSPIVEASKLSSGESETEIQIARVMSRLLRSDYLPHVDPKAVMTAVARGALKHGLVADGQSNMQSIAEFFSEHPLSTTVQRTGLRKAGDIRFVRVLKGTDGVRHPVEAVILLTALHGRWEEVETAFERKSDPSPSVPRETVVGKWSQFPSRKRAYRYAALRARILPALPRHIHAYKKERKQRPELAHGELLLKFPAEVRKFLTRKRLIAAGVDVPGWRRGTEGPTSIDGEFARYIDERGRYLRDTSFPGRISVRVLVRGFRRPNLFSQKHLNGQLSKSRAAVSRNEESKEQWIARTNSRAA